MKQTMTRVAGLACWLLAGMAVAQSEPLGGPPAGLVDTALGVTRQGSAIRCWLHQEDYELRTGMTRILLVGGTTDERPSTPAVTSALAWFYGSPAAERWRSRFLVSAVPALRSDPPESGLRDGSSRRDLARQGYPPPDNACYQSREAPEAAYLWRWLGMSAPDLVVLVRTGAERVWHMPPAEHPGWQRLATELQARPRTWGDDELIVQLNRRAPCETGFIPALEVAAADGTFLEPLLRSLDAAQFTSPSPARRELQRRLERSPREVAEQLSQHYGHALPQVAYIPAVAVIARLRLGDLSGDPRPLAEAEQIVAPYVRGETPTRPDNGSALPGHLLFCELAERSTGKKRDRYVQLARAAADLAFDKEGLPLASMPFHLEMSDSLFMGGPILAHVGSLTGEGRYFDACLRHLRFMRQLCLRGDGIYRHSPLDETAWGRGNGFPALGLALCLDKFPSDHPGREELRSWFRDHLQALLKHQDPTGCWRQVVDRPESYRELTATCMIGYALSLGTRKGWLDGAGYQTALDKAWYGVRTRAPGNGRLVDVCTGTGKQKSLRDYYDRPAILGPDDRGGAMSLLFAVEMLAREGR